MNWKPPQPRYISPREFGCQLCQNAVSYGASGSSEVSSILISVEEFLGYSLLDWTRSFQVCESCEAVWALSYNPKDMIHELTATPDGMLDALNPEPNLEDLMVPLFAWAPIDEMTEQALWEVDYDPQNLYDKLVAAWRSSKIDTARRADILRQLRRLLTGQNQHHKKRREEKGWLLADDRHFTQELEKFDSSDEIWRGHAYIAEDYKTLLSKLSGEGVLKSRPLVKSTQPSAKKKAKQPKKTVQVNRQEFESKPVIELTITEIPSLQKRIFELLNPAWMFLPAVIAAGFIEFLVSQMPLKHQMSGYTLLGLVLVLNGVAVMANSQITGLSYGRLVWNRLSALGDYLLFLVLYIVSTVFCFGLIGLFGVDATTSSETWKVSIAVFMFVFLQIRFWPFWLIPYMQSVESDIPSNDMLGNSKETALVSAWKLTKQDGSFLKHTLVWITAVVISIILLYIANHLGGQWGLGLTLYIIVLPVLTALTWALVEQLGFETS